MPNVGAGELLIIFLVALLVLGPTKLPDAARQAGRALAELRRLSSGFQDEMRSAMREPPPTLPPRPSEPVDGATATSETAAPTEPAPAGEPVAEPDETPRRRRRAPLRADGAVAAEQQLSE